MKLKPGVTVVTGGKRYKNEIPDNVLNEKTKKSIEGDTEKAVKKETPKKVKD